MSLVARWPPGRTGALPGRGERIVDERQVAGRQHVARAVVRSFGQARRRVAVIDLLGRVVGRRRLGAQLDRIARGLGENNQPHDNQGQHVKDHADQPRRRVLEHQRQQAERALAAVGLASRLLFGTCGRRWSRERRLRSRRRACAGRHARRHGNADRRKSFRTRDEVETQSSSTSSSASGSSESASSESGHATDDFIRDGGLSPGRNNPTDNHDDQNRAANQQHHAAVTTFCGAGRGDDRGDRRDAPHDQRSHQRSRVGLRIEGLIALQLEEIAIHRGRHFDVRSHRENPAAVRA